MVNGYETIGVNEPDFLNGPINLDNVEKVEVIVGPSSFFEPANTLVATVNVITRTVDGAAFTATAGSDVEYRGTAEAGKRWDENRWFSISLSSEKRDGFDAFDDRVGSSALQATQGHDWVGATDPSYHVVARGQLEGWSGQLQAYKSQWPHLLARGGWVRDGNPPGDQREDLSLLEEIYTASLRHDQEWNNHLETFGIVRFGYRSETKDPKIGDGEVTSRDTHLEVGSVYTRGAHIVQAGLQYSHDDYDDFTRDTGEEFLDGSADAIGLYLSDTWTVSDTLKTVFGVRADRNEVLPDHDWYFGGRAAVILRAAENWTTKLMANRVVKMPVPLASRMELWGANNNNPNVPPWARLNDTADKPERLTTLEWQNIAYFDDRNGRASMTLYYQDLQDFISWGGPWTNLGDYSGFGLEGDIAYRPNERMDYWLNFSWLDSTFDADNPDLEVQVLVDDEDRIIGSPRLTVNAGSSVALANDVYLSPSIRYMTKQSAYEVRSDSFKTIDNRYYLDAALLWNNAFSVKDMALRARVRNILDNRDYIAGSWLRGEYRPRGINGNLAIEYKF